MLSMENIDQVGSVYRDTVTYALPILLLLLITLVSCCGYDTYLIRTGITKETFLDTIKDSCI